MRRLISIAAFALVLAVPVWAQRGGHGGGGGHVGGGGGMHVGGFGGHAGGGHIGGGHSFNGVHSAGVRSGPGFTRGFNHSFNQNNGFHGHHNHHFDNFAFRNNCFGFGCRNFGWGSPWWGWGWYDPWLWSTWEDEDRRFDNDYYRQYEMADRWNQESLEQQRMMRQEEEDGDQDAYAPRSSARRATAEAQPESLLPPTVLVFRDQHKEEVSNYAIVGQTLWSFSVQKTKRIPLSDLDVPATQKANDDRGVTFRIPVASEGQ